MRYDLYLMTCAYPDDLIRWHLFQAVLARWRRDWDAIVRVLVPEPVHQEWIERGIQIGGAEVLKCDRRAFFGEAWFYASENGTDPYMITPDDIMPMNTEFCRRTAALLAERPEADWISPQVYHDQGHEPGTVWAHPEPKGPVMARQGAIAEVIRPHRGTMFGDIHVGEWMLAQGRVMYSTNILKFNDLGVNLGTTWPDDFRSGRTQIAG